MKRLTFHVEIAFGKDEPETEWREGHSIAERAQRDDPDERSELDHRRHIGFRNKETNT